MNCLLRWTAVATLVLAASAGAQPPRSVAVVADSMALAGDSAGARALLEDAVRRDKRDAAAWHQLGLMSWNSAKSKRAPGFISDRRVISLLQLADSALRLATQFAPDSARYWLSLGRFNLTSGVATMRASASGQVGNALVAAQKTGDSLLLAAAADEVGMATWRRYEPVANRGLDNTGAGISLASIKRTEAYDYLQSVARRIEPPTGDADYSSAFEQFRTAVRVDPTSQQYSRHLFMALAERDRWEEMRTIAAGRVRQYPLDFTSWQALGLALHRLNLDKGASAAFDSAMATMEDAERERMTQLTRILRPTPPRDKSGKIVQGAGDATTFLKLGEGQRKGLEQLYWLMSDPLVLTSENELRLEFLSRVVYADFRFSNEDLGLRGADTDRGDIYVRYGPPVHQVTIGAGGNALQSVTLAWVYTPDLVFFFDIVPGFATARTLFSDKWYVDEIKAAVPVLWENVATTKLLDTIPIRITRFRAGGDSVDAVVAARIPMDSLTRGLAMARVPVDVDFRVYDEFTRTRGVESVQSSVAPDSAPPMARTWTRRVGPGINVIRVEALQLDTRRAARAMSRLDPVPTTGFGMSEVLIGNKPELRGASTAARRWTDVAMDPSAGLFTAGSPIGLLWEMYDFSARDGSAKYRIAITVDRVDRTGVAGFAARLVDGVGRTLGRQQTTRSNLTISFERTATAARTLVEFLSLDLADATSGAYRLRVEVTDMVTGQKTSRQTEFRIR
jgi:GWxTD domain-containing protein